MGMCKLFLKIIIMFLRSIKRLKKNKLALSNENDERYNNEVVVSC